MRYFYVERMIKKSEFSKECDMSSVPLKKSAFYKTRRSHPKGNVLLNILSEPSNTIWALDSFCFAVSKKQRGNCH